MAALRARPGMGDLDPLALLEALLEAGTDDDPWSTYHERIVALVRALVERNGDLLDPLLAALEAALAGDDWPAKRIRLAAVAACAGAMPDALNLARSPDELEELLVWGTQDAGSHHSRRFAITALSHLRVATPAAVEALLAAGRDVAQVQRDAVAAAGRFRHLARGAFAREEALDALAVALTGESAAT